MEKVNGVVKWFNDSKGYGFIEIPGQPDLFVHFKAIRDLEFQILVEGQKVEFEIARGQKGPVAENVRVIR